MIDEQPTQGAVPGTKVRIWQWLLGCGLVLCMIVAIINWNALTPTVGQIKGEVRALGGEVYTTSVFPNSDHHSYWRGQLKSMLNWEAVSVIYARKKATDAH